MHMRSTITTLAAAVAVMLAGVWPVSSQSLGDLARKEEARRQAVKTPAKVYTNESLRAIAGDTIPTPPRPATVTEPPEGVTMPAPEATKSAPALPAASVQSDPPKNEAYWRKRITDARVQHDRNAVFLAALQSRINGLWADFTARDDPAQRAAIASERQRTLDELARLTAEQQDLEKQIAAIEEEARRAGVPPGWVR